MQLAKITAIYFVLSFGWSHSLLGAQNNGNGNYGPAMNTWIKFGEAVESKAFQYTLAPVLTTLIGRTTDHIIEEQGLFERNIIIESSEKGNFFTRMFSKPKFENLPVEKFLNFDAKTMENISDFQNQNLQNAKENREMMSALIYGPAGTGKTKAAKLIARDYHYDLISGSSLAGLPMDKAQQKLTQLIEKGKKKRKNNEKYVLIIDEAEYLFISRGSRDISVKTEALLPLFLALVEKGTHPNFFIMAQTNRPEILDSAIFRRFPVKIEIPLPAAETRTEIFTRYLKPFIDHHTNNPKLGIAIHDDARDLSAFAADSEGFSPNEIESAVNYAKAKAKLRHRLNALIIRDALKQIKI